jgi:hypothetical protein
MRQPDRPFIALTKAIEAAFPNYPHWGGEFEEVIPHLTLADGVEAPALEPRLARLRALVEPLLPMKLAADDATILVNEPSGHWVAAARLPLGKWARRPSARLGQCSGMCTDMSSRELQGWSQRADELPPHSPEVRMVARTSTWTGTPEALDKWEAHVKTQVSGFVAGLPGNAGGVFFVDRAAGTALTLTLWDSEEAAAETDKFADQSRASTVDATGVELVGRGAYEVVTRF